MLAGGELESLVASAASASASASTSTSASASASASAAASACSGECGQASNDAAGDEVESNAFCGDAHAATAAGGGAAAVPAADAAAAADADSGAASFASADGNKLVAASTSQRTEREESTADTAEEETKQSAGDSAATRAYHDAWNEWEKHLERELLLYSAVETADDLAFAESPCVLSPSSKADVGSILHAVVCYLKIDLRLPKCSPSSIICPLDFAVQFSCTNEAPI